MLRTRRFPHIGLLLLALTLIACSDGGLGRQYYRVLVSDQAYSLLDINFARVGQRVYLRAEVCTVVTSDGSATCSNSSERAAGLRVLSRNHTILSIDGYNEADNFYYATARGAGEAELYIVDSDHYVVHETTFPVYK